MILVFGGTTEGKAIADLLNKKQLHHFYSTKTFNSNVCGAYTTQIQGGMNNQQMLQFCREKGISLILNGSHPFAINLHETIAFVATNMGIPVLRLERYFPSRKEGKFVKYFDDFDQASNYIEAEEFDSLLALTGVQTIPLLKSFWVHKTCWFRILDTVNSRAMANKFGFPASRLIFSSPGATVEQEVSLILRTKAQVIISKESGSSGFFTNKMEAALFCKIPFLVIKRPTLPSSFYSCLSLPLLEKKLDEWLLIQQKGDMMDSNSYY